MDQLAQHVATQLRVARQAARLDRADVARRAQIAAQTYARYEQGQLPNGIAYLLAAARVLGLTPNVLFGVDGLRGAMPLTAKAQMDLLIRAVLRLHERFGNLESGGGPLEVTAAYMHQLAEQLCPSEGAQPAGLPTGTLIQQRGPVRTYEPAPPPSSGQKGKQALAEEPARYARGAKRRRRRARRK